MPDLSFLGPAGASVVIVYLFLKAQREEGEKRDKSSNRLASSIEKSHETDKELLQFMKNLNGKLVQTVKDKQEEVK